MYDAIIIGSGLAGTTAAWELRNKKILLLDVGIDQPKKKIKENLFNLKQHDREQRDYLIGKNFESLRNIKQQEEVSVKLKAPYVSYVIRELSNHFKVESENFTPFLSFSYGGLANAWGGGVFRYNDHDLKQFPLSRSDLEPFYNELTEEIGICGANDDLAKFFGQIDNLQPNLPLNQNADRLFKYYQKHSKKFKKKGINIGRQHLALLTQKKEGREIYNNENTTFFSTETPGVYTPQILLKKIEETTNIEIKKDIFVKTFKSENNQAQVNCLNLKTGETIKFYAKKLLIAAGAIGSAKIVLESYSDYSTELPILDNQISFVPFIDIKQLGKTIDPTAYEGGQLTMIYSGELFPRPVQASFYSFLTPLRSDIFFKFPLSISGNLNLTRNLIPAMTIVQFFYPDHPKKENYLRLKKNHSLFINYQNIEKKGVVEKLFLKKFFPAGFIGFPFLIEYPNPGNGIHYAGTIPMGRKDQKYHVDTNCLLNKTQNIYVIDGSIFPDLPSRNYSFTIMANAKRAARELKQIL